MERRFKAPARVGVHTASCGKKLKRGARCECNVQRERAVPRGDRACRKHRMRWVGQAVLISRSARAWIGSLPSLPPRLLPVARPACGVCPRNAGASCEPCEGWRSTARPAPSASARLKRICKSTKRGMAVVLGRVHGADRRGCSPERACTGSHGPTKGLACAHGTHAGETTSRGTISLPSLHGRRKGLRPGGGRWLKGTGPGPAQGDS